MLGQSLFAIIMGLLVFSFSQDIISLVLGREWLDDIAIFKVQILTMIFGSLIAVIMPIFKAKNLLNIVLKSNILSILFLIIWFQLFYDIFMIAIGYALAVFTSLVFLTTSLWKRRLL